MTSNPETATTAANVEDAGVGLALMEALMSFNELLRSALATVEESGIRQHSERRATLTEEFFMKMPSPPPRDAINDFVNNYIRNDADRDLADKALRELLAMARDGSTSPIGARAQWVLMQLKTHTPGAELVRRGSFLLAVSAFEDLVGALVRYFYSACPDHLRNSGKTWKSHEVLSTQSLQELFEIAREYEADRVMRPGFAKWPEWFKENRSLEIDWASLCDFEELTELFLRRHALVHTGARVNAEYFAQVKTSDAVGSPLSISLDYCVERIGFLLSLGTRLTHLTVRRVDTVTGRTLGEIVDLELGMLASDLFEESRYRSVVDICEQLLPYSGNSAVVLQVLACTAEGAFREAPKEVILEYSDSNSELKQFVACLMAGAAGEAVLRTPGIVAAGQLSVNALFKERLYAPIREHPDFPHLASSLRANATD